MSRRAAWSGCSWPQQPATTPSSLRVTPRPGWRPSTGDCSTVRTAAEKLAARSSKNPFTSSTADRTAPAAGCRAPEGRCTATPMTRASTGSSRPGSGQKTRPSSKTRAPSTLSATLRASARARPPSSEALITDSSADIGLANRTRSCGNTPIRGESAGSKAVITSSYPAPMATSRADHSTSGGGRIRPNSRRRPGRVLGKEL